MQECVFVWLVETLCQEEQASRGRQCHALHGLSLRREVLLFGEEDLFGAFQSHGQEIDDYWFIPLLIFYCT